ncbi:MAG: class I SAM-dependent methyltransferase [Mycobacterium sp.]
MARTENDTWDLASSVGATATMVAAARAVASKEPNAVIDDPFAEPLVRAVGVDFFTRMASGELDPAVLDTDGAGAGKTGFRNFSDGMAARTRFFDDFFTDAGNAGIRQAVILASGLDARAYRLSWPAGTVVFEIDQPAVIAFKTETLAGLGALPTADLRTVAIDLRDDWPTALKGAGFDPTAPTAWIAEGLFGYLPPEAQDKLLDTITELSAPGSQIGAESVPSINDADEAEVREKMQSVSAHWRAQGFDMDFSELVFLGDRAEVTTYLQGHGWTTTSVSARDLLAKNGLEVPADGDDPGFGDVVYVSATN